MSFTQKIAINEYPLDYVCDEVTQSLVNFVSREHEYIYAPDNKRKLFTLADKEEFVHKSSLSIDEYIKVHNLEYEWRRLHIKETFTYKQRQAFRNSDLTLEEFVDKHHLCDKPNPKHNSRNYTDTSDSDASYDNCNEDDEDDGDDEDGESVDSWGENI